MTNKNIIFVACNGDYASRFGRMNISVKRLDELYEKLPEGEK